MPRFHAAFSVGTVAGALVGAGLVALHVSVTTHLIGVALLIGVGVPLSVRAFVPDHSGDGTGADAGSESAGESTDGAFPITPARRPEFEAWLAARQGGR
jgi:putative Mn2+ efflux pump MntP